MDTGNLPKNNTSLNPCQFTALQSISRTMVCTSAEEPKIALLHGPPGTGKSRVIVEIILRTMSLHHEKPASSHAKGQPRKVFISVLHTGRSIPVYRAGVAVATRFALVAKKQLFEQSLFHRLCSIRMSPDEENKGVTVLKTQYRMAKAICEWPSKYFYDGKLVTAESLIRHGPCNEYRVFNVIDGIEQLADQSFKNEKEADLVANIVRVILESPLCIIRKLNEVDASALRVEVNTVDSFQGKEKDIIIISCVRASQALQNFGGGIGFIFSKQRINVALTRPKESLIVCGHFPTLITDETWRSLINNAEGRHFAHDVSSKSASDDLRHLLMRPTPREQQRMVADLSELSGMKATWATKSENDTCYPRHWLPGGRHWLPRHWLVG
ncbi:hypothetical protein DAPPUDRAFT_94481 [Daphnia pulex]|uniref:DNA2/NAM7 helicase-like C-terminal domain-containing protein n=1 Tax=Daphnia pulex TaxID=6669 RepID=E9FRF6_DAPPU|nr:hypothetical protein DAPPUDRAFT_94481 [Daphnia pulex]|eukprot:EFX90208.1 hypothetical protein DAPPUDRAFT_94481 [Daphnia pulex]